MDIAQKARVQSVWLQGFQNMLLVHLENHFLNSSKKSTEKSLKLPTTVFHGVKTHVMPHCFLSAAGQGELNADFTRAGC